MPDQSDSVIRFSNRVCSFLLTLRVTRYFKESCEGVLWFCIFTYKQDNKAKADLKEGFTYSMGIVKPSNTSIF